MAEIDTSFYPKATNPIDNLSTAANIGSIGLRNQLMQQELGANTGLQKLYQGAPKDADGNIDQNYLMQNASQAGIRAPEVMQFAQGAQLTAQQIQQQRLATQRSKMSMMASAVAPLAKPGSTPGDFVASGNNLIQASGGLIGKEDLIPIYNAMAEHVASGGNTSDYAKKLFGQMLMGGGDVAEGNKMLYGTPTSVETGGGTMTGTQDPVTGAVTSGSYVPKTLPPTTPLKDPNTGATYYAGSAAPSQPVPTGPNGNSPLAGAFREPVTTAPTSPAMAELPPGQQTMLTDAGKSAQGRVDQTIQTASQARVSQDVNQQIMKLADNLHDNVGPAKTGWTTLIGRIADTPGLGEGMKAVMDKDPTDTVGQLQELQKYLLRSAQMRGQSLGLGGTDYQASLAQHANPNDAQNPATIKRLAEYNLALDAMEQGKANALDQYQGAKTDPQANQKFENEFRNALNPDVYRALIATPTERKDLFTAMTPAQRQQMVVDRRKLMSLGAIPSQLTNSFQAAPGQ